MGVGNRQLELLVRSRTLIVGLCLGGVPLAVAQSGDRPIRPYVEFGYAYDSNLLRTPDLATSNRDQLSDTMRTITAGMIFERTLGRQSVNARVNLSRTYFDRFKNIDFDSRDVQANLNWQLGSKFSGSLNTRSDTTLSPFTELNDGQRNIRTSDRSSANAVWSGFSGLQLSAGAANAEFHFDSATQRSGNRRIQTQNIGVDFLPASGNRIGVLAQRSQAKFPIDAPGAPKRLNDYIENELKLRLDFNLSGKTSVRFVGGKTQRLHEILPVRDFNGFNARLAATMVPTGKQVVTVNLFREVGAVDNLITNFTINQGISLDTVWVPSAKLRVEGRFSFEKRDFNSLGGLLSNRMDQLHNASLGVIYTPYPFMQIGVTATRDSLRSNQTFRTNHAGGVATSIRLQY